MIVRKLCFAATFLALASTAALADNVKVGDLMIEGAWTRATAPSAPNAGAFLTIRNMGNQDDRLVSASSPVDKKTELHTHTMTDGVMKMRPVEAIDVPPGGTVELKPGGLHVMLIGLDKPLVQGTEIPITLTFERAGTTTIDVPVMKAGAAKPMHGHGAHGHGAHGGEKPPHRP